MKRKPKVYFFFFIVAGLALYMLWNSFSQPGIGDLNGEFHQIALYRNENNTGPITRIYAVAVNDTLWGEMRKYGDFMLHTKYGNTKVYFFLKGSPAPDNLFPGNTNFDESYNKYCLAKYEKDNIGQVRFLKYTDAIVN